MDKLKYYRNKRNLSQKDIGDYVGVTQGMISNYESGTKRMPYKSALILSSYLQCKPEDILISKYYWKDKFNEILDKLETNDLRVLLSVAISMCCNINEL